MTDTFNSTDDKRTENNVLRHEYRPLANEEKEQVKKIKDLGLELLNYIKNLGSSRELSLAATKTEEATMWAVKHITK